ncbi:Uncharacterised protein [Raoultella terrigena]|uniref:Uncharacterized protein n=1 Tax=Raoultella terrigena TaxID=577 RepID=A0A3P8KT52_RAOTE|nr:Uncharacterised protein [Raoultella terrigena]
MDILSRTPTDAVDLLSQSGYTVHDSTEANQLFLGWNFANKYTSQLAVRQAVIKAINRRRAGEVAAQRPRGGELQHTQPF